MFEVRSFVDEYGQKWGEYDLYHSDHFKDISDFEEEGWYWDCDLLNGGKESGPFKTKDEAIYDANGYTPEIVEYEIRSAYEYTLESR